MEFKLFEVSLDGSSQPYPAPIYANRTRGHVSYDANPDDWRCEFCGTCASRCPAKAIAVDDKAFTWTFDRFSCVLCGCCVRACFEKTKSLEMRPEFAPIALEKAKDVYVAPEDEDDDDDFDFDFDF